MLLQGWLPSNWGWGGKAAAVGDGGGGVGVGGGGAPGFGVGGGGGGGPPGFAKLVHNIYVFATGNLVAPPVALDHYNKVTIGFVIHKNLQKYVHDISNPMAAKWGRFNRQMSNSKMAAKTEDGGCKIGASRLKLLVWPISTTMRKIKLLPKRVSDQSNKNGTLIYGLQRNAMLVTLLSCIESPK